MASSDTISLTPEETENIVNAINFLTNNVAGINESIKAGITPKTIDAAANLVAVGFVNVAHYFPSLVGTICGFAASLA
jgi:hypothetical protein